MYEVFYACLFGFIKNLFWLLQLGDLSNPELRILTDQLEKIKYGGKFITKLLKSYEKRGELNIPDLGNFFPQI